MNETTSLSDQLQASISEFWSIIGGYLPKVIGALLLIVLAVLVAKLAQAAVEKALELVGVNRLAKSKSVAKGLKTAEIELDFVGISGRIVFWLIIIVFSLTIADVLELNAMRDVMSKLLGYLPSVLAAAIVLTVTVAGARLVRDVLTTSLRRIRVDFAHVIGNITFYVLLVFGTIMAIDQLGFDTTVITANITIIVSGLVLALALAFGLGGRSLAEKLLNNAYESYDNLKKAKSNKR